MLTVTNEQSLQLFTYFTQLAAVDGIYVGILVDTTLKCGLTTTCTYCVKYAVQVTYIL